MLESVLLSRRNKQFSNTCKNFVRKRPPLPYSHQWLVSVNWLTRSFNRQNSVITEEDLWERQLPTHVGFAFSLPLNLQQVRLNIDKHARFILLYRESRRKILNGFANQNRLKVRGKIRCILSLCIFVS